MTADLPPHWLDVMPETRAEVKEYAEEYGKLCARQALERAEHVVLNDAGKWETLPEIAYRIRAIAEEYK